MDIRRILKPYHYIFFICGHCSHPDRRVAPATTSSPAPSSNQNRCRKLYHHLPLVVFTISLIITSVCGINGHVKGFRSIRSTHQIMKYVFFPGETICGLIIIRQCYRSRLFLPKMSESLATVDRMIVHELDFSPDYTAFGRRLWWYVWLPIMIFAVSVSILFTSWYFQLSTIDYSPSLYILQFPIIMSCSHSIVYIETLRFYLNALNCHIKIQTTFSSNLKYMSGYHFFERSKTKFIRQQLKIYKRVHMCLWTIAEQINSYFGWSLTTNILANIFDFVYDIHWLYLCHEGTCSSQLGVLGSYKYKFWFFFLLCSFQFAAFNDQEYSSTHTHTTHT